MLDNWIISSNLMDTTVSDYENKMFYAMLNSATDQTWGSFPSTDIVENPVMIPATSNPFRESWFGKGYFRGWHKLYAEGVLGE